MMIPAFARSGQPGIQEKQKLLVIRWSPPSTAIGGGYDDWGRADLLREHSSRTLADVSKIMFICEEQNLVVSFT
jgi:hypothetical protein